MILPDLSGTPWRAIVLSEKHEVWTLVSAARYPWLMQWGWNISWGSGCRWKHYAKRNEGPSRATVRMHREILQQIEPLPPEEAAQVHGDHLNGCALDRIVRTPTSDTPHRKAGDHYAADFEAIRKLTAPYRTPTK